MYAALASTVIPKVKILQGGEEGAGPDIELLDQEADGELFDVSHVPIFVSLAQIGQRELRLWVFEDSWSGLQLWLPRPPDADFVHQRLSSLLVLTNSIGMFNSFLHAGYVVDATSLEESCSSARVAVGVNGENALPLALNP
jgi:exosome complex RNA-binding protein Rrp42 (RNase PH superfamily)